MSRVIGKRCFFNGGGSRRVERGNVTVRKSSLALGAAGNGFGAGLEGKERRLAREGAAAAGRAAARAGTGGPRGAS